MPSSAANGSSPSFNNASNSHGESRDGAAEAIKIKAVIYDLDGTLLDTESLSTEAIQAVVGRFGATFTWCVFEQRPCAALGIDTLTLLHTPPWTPHREIKKRILGMRGEEWGRIVVDGTYRPSQVEPPHDSVKLTTSVQPQPKPYRAGSGGSVGAHGAGEGVGEGAGGARAYRPGRYTGRQGGEGYTYIIVNHDPITSASNKCTWLILCSCCRGRAMWLPSSTSRGSRRFVMMRVLCVD